MGWVRYSHADVDRTNPRALGVCDRCGFVYNQYKLQWQYEWVATKLQNIRQLVCESCYDKPQEQLRRILIPPDPVPIMNPRPENYPNDDNPISTIGGDPNIGFGMNFGTVGNPNLAFDGSVTKKFIQSACLNISVSGLNNFVGKNWTQNVGGITTPSSIVAPNNNQYRITSFTATAPLDSSFIGNTAVAFKFQGSFDGTNYIDLFTGTTTGTPGESVTGTPSPSPYVNYHRIVFTGDGVNGFAIAQLSMVGTPINNGNTGI